MARMKGLGVIQLVKFVRRWARQQRIEDVAKAFGMEESTILSGRVLVSSWYPYEEFATLLREIRRRIAGGDPEFFVRLGRISAETDLDSALSSFTLRRDFERFARGLALVWKAYCDTGEIRIEQSAPGASRTIFEGAPHLAPEHCLINLGWIAASLERGGAKDVKVTHDECVSLGASHCVFQVAYRAD